MPDLLVPAADHPPQVLPKIEKGNDAEHEGALMQLPRPQFGLFVPQFRTSVSDVLATAQHAEELGYDSFWIMDHLFAPMAPPLDVLESWTLITALAGATSRIRLGHLVGCNPFRHPSLLAKMAATVDQISGGRLDLGLGWGSVDEEFGKFGFEVGTRGDRSRSLAETLEILEHMFTGEPFDYDGKYFTLRNAWGLPRPVQDRIPIHIGGGGKALTMPLVAKYADWWNCVGGARKDLGELALLRGGARISAQYAIGLLGRESDRAEVTSKALRRLPISSWGEPLIGTPDQVATMLQADRERGVELFTLRFHDNVVPATIELFAREVAAPLRAAA